MKKIRPHLLAALVLAGTFLVGCSNPFAAPKTLPEAAEPGRGEEGTGFALISLAGTDGARTLFPSIVPAEFYYVFTLTPGEGTAAETLTEDLDRSSSKSLELAAGGWSLDLKGYLDAAHAEEAPDDPGLTGSAVFAVPKGGQAEVRVSLTAAGRTEYGKGEFAYTVSFPANVYSAALSLVNITATGDPEPVNLLDGAVESGGVKTVSGVMPELWAGFYRVVLDLGVQIEGLPSRTLRTRAVRIHDSLRTRAVEYFTEADFFKGRKFDTLKELKAYLDGLPQNTRDNPYSVALAIDLSSITLKEENDSLGALYAALTRYVDLDLSECQGTIIGQSSSSFFPNRPNGPNLVSVTLPSALTTIGAYAFAKCANLSSIDLSGITVIGYSGFQNCDSLTSITWPATIALSGSAFYGAGLSGDLALPNVTSFGQLDFSKTGIRSIDLSACTELTRLPSFLFTDCKELREVKLPAGRTNFTIEDYAFQGCESLDTLNWEVFSNGSLSVGIYVFDGTAFSSLFSFGIFKTVNYAFINMPNLASVDMSGWTGTTLSAVNGFTGCASLESFTLGSNLTFIDANAFTGSASIRFYPGSNTSFTVSDDHIMLFNADKTTLVAANGVAGSVAIPSTVTVIAANAFRDCAALTEITLPAGLTTIGQGAFVNCNIEVVTLPSSLTSLSNGAFGSSLKTVKIPGDLGLTLARTTFSGVVYELLSGGGSGGYEVFANGKLVVKDHIALFASTELSGPLVLDPSITSITAYAFEYHKGLTSVDMSACAGLESIGNGAFYAATGLEWVKWPQSAADASVGSSAFYGATKLSRVELPDHLSSIGTSAFYSTNLTVLILRSPAVGLSSANTVSPNTLVSIYVPDAGVSAYKAATSWNNAALVNKIVGISALDDPDNADDNPANWS